MAAVEQDPLTTVTVDLEAMTVEGSVAADRRGHARRRPATR